MTALLHFENKLCYYYVLECELVYIGSYRRSDRRIADYFNDLERRFR